MFRLDSRLSSMRRDDSRLCSVFIAMGVVRCLEALDVVQATLKERTNKVGEAIDKPVSIWHTMH
jgi:hypothetical protein